jgi:ribonuclease VapC
MIDLSQETEDRARRRADTRHVPVDTVIKDALAAVARGSPLIDPHRTRDAAPEAVARRRASLDRFVEKLAALPVLDSRSPQAIAAGNHRRSLRYMIVVDSAAPIAIFQREPEHQAFRDTATGEQRCIMSAVNAHEAATVIPLRSGVDGVEDLWHLLADLDLEVVPFDLTQVRVASVADDRSGKGINVKARLDLGDCAAYALAKTMNAPLLFKGNDFTQTDLQSCV